MAITNRRPGGDRRREQEGTGEEDKTGKEERTGEEDRQERRAGRWFAEKAVVQVFATSWTPHGGVHSGS